ncbi:hypothetical protein MKEN_00139300 [Mycena kentingensis (nom. inval.)]|nr:hypothetical protein MKEN_00139300 [Mycena kentingensis (nom. inval.)]
MSGGHPPNQQHVGFRIDPIDFAQYEANRQLLENAQAEVDRRKALNDEGYRMYQAAQRQQQEDEEFQHLANLKAQAELRMQELAARRRAAQPDELPSARIEEINSPDRVSNYSQQQVVTYGQHQPPQASTSRAYHPQVPHHAPQQQPYDMSRAYGNQRQQQQHYGNQRQHYTPVIEEPPEHTPSYVPQRSNVPSRPSTYGASPFTTNPGNQRLAELGSSTRSSPIPAPQAIGYVSEAAMSRQPQRHSSSTPSSLTNALVSATNQGPALGNGQQESSAMASNLPHVQQTITTSKPHALVANSSAQSTPKPTSPSQPMPQANPLMANPVVRPPPPAVNTVQPLPNSKPPPIANVVRQPASRPSATPAATQNASASSSHHAETSRWQKFQVLINSWQKAVADTAILDIPNSSLRVIKRKGGFLFFYDTRPITASGSGSSIWVPPAKVDALLRLGGTVQVYTVKRTGEYTLLQTPLSPNMVGKVEFFNSPSDPKAPNAKYPNYDPQQVQRAAPNVASSSAAFSQRSTKDVKPNFLAHDLLRALGKTNVYTEDNEYVQYAKRRAVMLDNAPKPIPVPVPVAAPIPPPMRAPLLHAPMPTHAPTVPPSVLQQFRVDSAAAAAARAAVAPARPQPMASTSRVNATARKAKTSTTREKLWYILVPESPQWVKDLQAKEAARKRKEKMDVDEDPIVVEEEEEAAVDAIVVDEEEEAPDSEPERERERLAWEQKATEKENKRARERELGNTPKVDLNILAKRSRGRYKHVQNDAEAAAIGDALDCLREVNCQWFDCGAKLNSQGNLVDHLRVEHGVPRQDEGPSCLWEGCGEMFANAEERVLHVEKHGMEAIQCAYQGCDMAVRRPAELVVHHRIHAREGREMRPSAVPRLVAPLRPNQRPSRSVNASDWYAPPVLQRVDRLRHEQLGPWVLRNICGPTTRARIKRYNAAKPMPAVEMEFFEAPSKQFSSTMSQPTRFKDAEFAVLEGREVTADILEGGLVFWPEPEEQVVAGPSGMRVQDEEEVRPKMEEGEENASERTVLGDSGSGSAEAKEVADEWEHPRIEVMDQGDDHSSGDEEQVLDMLQGEE